MASKRIDANVRLIPLHSLAVNLSVATHIIQHDTGVVEKYVDLLLARAQFFRKQFDAAQITDIDLNKLNSAGSARLLLELCNGLLTTLLATRSQVHLGIMTQELEHGIVSDTRVTTSNNDYQVRSIAPSLTDQVSQTTATLPLAGTSAKTTISSGSSWLGV